MFVASVHKLISPQLLKSLKDVRLSYLDESKPGFKLHFTFGANEFFEDKELTKTYYYQVSQALTQRSNSVDARVGEGRLRR
jgi:hypothetical protein